MEDEDLIAIQRGEIVMEASTFAGDYVELIRYCEANSPRVKELVIGNIVAMLEVEQATAKGIVDADASRVKLDVTKDNQAAQSDMGENFSLCTSMWC